jgi:hypothetical protein
MKTVEKKNVDYRQLVSQISETFVHGQQKAAITVNSFLVETNWKIGQYIVEYEQGGSSKAEYGKRLLERLSKDLSLLHGKGFSLSNIKRMRQFYQLFPIGAEVPHQLSWTHFVELLKIDDTTERSFYLNQTINENWSTTQLIRQKKASLFIRLAASKDKEGVMKLAQEGQSIVNPIDIIREPYIVVEYAMHNISSRLFASKYQLYLPTKEELKQIIERSSDTL